MAPQGEVKRLTFKPGEAEPKEGLLDTGTYDLSIERMGKPGLAGWRAGKAGKYPNRPVEWSIHDTESDLNPGKTKMVTEFISLSPGFWFRIRQLAIASEYTEEMDVEAPEGPEDTARVQAMAEAVDGLLNHIKDNGLVLRAQIGQDTYNGEQVNRITKFLPPEQSAAVTEETSAAEEETPAEEPEATEEEPEQLYPPPAPPKPKAPVHKAPPPKPAAKAVVKPGGKKK